MEPLEENRKLVVTGRVNLLHFAGVFEALAKEQEEPLTRSDALDQCVEVVFQILEKKGLARLPGSPTEAAAILETRKALPPKGSENRRPLERLISQKPKEEEDLSDLREEALRKAADIFHGEKGLPPNTEEEIIPKNLNVLREEDLEE